jgi:hypothetical protein
MRDTVHPLHDFVPEEADLRSASLRHGLLRGQRQVRHRVPPSTESRPHATRLRPLRRAGANRPGVLFLAVVDKFSITSAALSATINKIVGRGVSDLGLIYSPVLIGHENHWDPR